MTFKPYADDTSCLTIGDWTAENHPDRICVFGSIDITRDKAGLAAALKIEGILRSIVAELQADGELADSVKDDRVAPVAVANPFGTN
jgi:hypothetical protein